MKNLIDNVAVRLSLGPKAESTTPEVGAAVDRMGYQRVLGVLGTGAQTGTSITMLMQESDTTTTGDFTTVADADCLGGTATIVVTTANDIKHHVREYIGKKRYVRWNFSATSSGVCTIDAFFILSDKSHAPTAEEAAG